MRTRINTFVAALFAFVLAGTVQAAADQSDPRLDSMFEILESDTLAPSEAGPLLGAIWRIWTETGDVRGDTLMRDGTNAMNSQDFDGAITIFTALTEHLPNVAEGWNKRATVYYLANRFEESIADVEKTLALEPRHFGALSGLGLIYMQLDETRAAVKAFEKALEINPYMPFVEIHLRQLREKLEEERI